MVTKSSSPARNQRRRAAGNRHDNRDVRVGIWVVQSIPDGRRIPLLGDLRHEHFYFTEGDPLVDHAEYDAPPVTTTLGSGEEAVGFDAIVHFVDGRTECRRVSARPLDPSNEASKTLLDRYQAAARRRGGVFVEITPGVLDRAQTRIWNWVRVVGAYHRAHEHSLALAEAGLQAAVSDGRVHCIGQILDTLHLYPPALVLAAIAKHLRLRLLSSDLDSATWSRNTELRAVGATS